MRAQRRKADFQNIALAAAGVKHRASATLAMGIDDIVDRSVNAGPRQRFDHKPALPIAVACRVPVLQRAAAASAEMRTDWCNALRARHVDANKAATIRMAGPGNDLGSLAWQHIGHVERARRCVRDPVATAARPFDLQALNHEACDSGRTQARPGSSESMIPKSGNRFSEKDHAQTKARPASEVSPTFKPAALASADSCAPSASGS